MSTPIPLKRSRMKIDVKAIASRARGSSFGDKIRQHLGDLSKYTLLGSDVLVATYVAPQRTAGGILLPDSAIEEDRWQGTVGLVLKVGPIAFKYIGPYPYEGPAPQIGDYVMYFASDSRECGIRGQSCRIVSSDHVRMIVPDPDDLY